MSAIGENSNYPAIELVNFLGADYAPMLVNLLKVLLASGQSSIVPWLNTIGEGELTLGQNSLKQLSDEDRRGERVWGNKSKGRALSGQVLLSTIMGRDGVDLSERGKILPYAFEIRAVEFIRHCWESGHVDSKSLMALGNRTLPDYTSCYVFKKAWEDNPELSELAAVWYEEKFQNDWIMPNRSEIEVNLTRRKKNWSRSEADRFVLERLWPDYLEEVRGQVDPGVHAWSGHVWVVLSSPNISQNKTPILNMVGADTWASIALLDEEHGKFFRKMVIRAAAEHLEQMDIPQFPTGWLTGELFERHRSVPENCPFYAKLLSQFVSRMEIDSSIGLDGVRKVLFGRPELKRDCSFIEKVYQAIVKRGDISQEQNINPDVLDGEWRERLTLISLLASVGDLKDILGFWNGRLGLVKNRARGEDVEKCGIIAKVLWCRLKEIQDQVDTNELRAALWINLLQSDQETVSQLIERISQDGEVLSNFTPPKNHRPLLRMMSKLRLDSKELDPLAYTVIKRVALSTISKTPAHVSGRVVIL